MKSFLTIICVALTLSLSAQLPTTHIYTLDMKANEQKVIVDNLTLLTAFNADGYNNQPIWLDGQNLMITSDHEAFGLTDIYHLNVALKKVTRVTQTEESEYSPTPMPDGIHFSVVRQELDDSQPVPQTLWQYPLDKSHGGSLLVDRDNIGYHCWMDEKKIALFLVDDPSELVIYDTESQRTSHVAYDVGRALKTDKRGHLHYIHKIASTWNIRKYDPAIERSTLVTKAIPVQEDFDILPNGFLITGDGSTLFIHKGDNQGWQELIDLSSAGIKNITRIASTAGKIAIVTGD